jgi:hypothetical protein
MLTSSSVTTSALGSARRPHEADKLRAAVELNERGAALGTEELERAIDEMRRLAGHESIDVGLEPDAVDERVESAGLGGGARGDGVRRGARVSGNDDKLAVEINIVVDIGLQRNRR